MRTVRKEYLCLFSFLLLWFCLNLLFLARYPQLHSDEAWLGGLTRNMLAQGSLRVTEPFFDLKPRFPHAIKILFHLLQMPLIAVFGYSVYALRLLSLIFGALSLYMVYRSLREAAQFPFALSLTAALSVNGQFIQAAHTARQECILLFVLLWCVWILLKNGEQITIRTAIRLAVLTGLSAGLHPNSFLIALGCGFAMLFIMLTQRNFAWKPLLAYIGVTGGIALLFVGISLWFDGGFISHWLSYGDTEFELRVPVLDKLGGLLSYLSRLWSGVSGTYILPELRPQLLLWAGLFLGSSIYAIVKKSASAAAVLGMALGAVLGTALIGRYNQLSAILWMFPCLLLPGIIPWRRIWMKRIIPAVLAVLFALAAAGPIVRAYSSDYDAYIQKISASVSENTKTLANLNTGFYFDNDALLDVRNLSFLQDNDMSFAEYVESRGIGAIVWSDEMNFIYDHRPDFNVLYGNPRIVPEAEAFFREHCILVATFEEIGYGMRLVQLIGEPCMVRIYRVNP
ncbi:MAG TPA: hypothetical protein PKU80_02960 [Candidatus Limiplasma sp.]|nr:hypothetical protein [Candidatus Limiplasma sp.]